MADTTTKERPAMTGEVFDAPSQTTQLARPGAPAPGEQQAPPHEEPQMRFSREQIELLKRTIAKDASDDELELFVQVCTRRRLDPFARQIHFVKRQGQATFQTGIDGFRLIAERTGKYAGQLPIEWARVTWEDGDVEKPVIRWYEIWPFDDAPHSARARILRTDFKEPITAVARFDAYAQYKGGDGGTKLVRMWETMGPEQLGKCAEALGLRKAFPEELSGIYTTDEMAQAENPEGHRTPDEDERPRPAKRQAEDRRPPAAAGEVKTLADAIEFKLPWRRHAKYGTPIVELSNKNLERALEWCDKVRKETEAEGNKPGPVVTNLERAASLILAARETGELETPAEEAEDPSQQKLFSGDPESGMGARGDPGAEPDPTGTPPASSPPTPAASAPLSDASSTSTPSSTSASPTTTPTGSSPKPTSPTSVPSGSTASPAAPSSEAAPDPAHPLKFKKNTTPGGRAALEALENTEVEDVSKHDFTRLLRDAIDAGPFEDRERQGLKTLFASADTIKKLVAVKKSVMALARELPF